MKVNDLVRIKKSNLTNDYIQKFDLGIIVDCLEMDDGFYEYEVLLSDGNIGWYSDILLEVIQK